MKFLSDLLKNPSTRFVLIFLLLLVIIVAKRTDVLERPQFFVEDGAIFFVTPLWLGEWKALLTPSADYSHLLPRLIALCSSEFAARWQPLIYIYSSIVIVALAGAAITLNCYRNLVRSDALRMVLPCVAYSAASCGALMGNITNLLWFLLPLATLILATPPQSINSITPIKKLLVVVLTLIIVLSQPLCIVLIPFALWRLVGYKGLARLVPISIILGSIAQSIIFILRSGGVGKEVSFVRLFSEAFVAISSRVVLCTLVGQNLAQTMSCGFRISFLLSICVALFIGLYRVWWKRRDSFMLIVSCLYLIFGSVAFAIKGRLGGSNFVSLCNVGNWNDGDRYFLLGSFVLLFLITVVLDALPIRRRIAVPILLATASLGMVDNFRNGYSRYDSNWPSHAEAVDAWITDLNNCRASGETVIPLNPGWIIYLPSIRSCSGSIQLDNVIVSDKAQTTYFLDHGKKRLVANPTTLMNLGVNETTELSAKYLRQLPFGAPVPFLPGKAIKDAANGESFFIEKGHRRYLPDKNTASCLGITKHTILLSEHDTEAIPLGVPLKSSAYSCEGALALQSENGPPYLIVNGSRRRIPNAKTLQALDLGNKVIHVSESQLDAVPIGEDLSLIPGKLIESDSTHNVFLMKGGRRYCVAEPAKYKRKLQGEAYTLPDSVVKSLPLGTPCG